MEDAGKQSAKNWIANSSNNLAATNYDPFTFRYSFIICICYSKGRPLISSDAHAAWLYALALQYIH
jgi:hypothetical protein